jgi:hypothetical protein
LVGGIRAIVFTRLDAVAQIRSVDTVTDPEFKPQLEIVKVGWGAVRVLVGFRV